MSSKRALRRKQCKGKVRHETREFALIALRHTRSYGNLSPYKCRFCGGWHIGHTPGMQGMSLKRS